MPTDALVLADRIAEEALTVGTLARLERLAGSSVLLTGASGLIGTWMLASLPEDPGKRPCEVVAVTRSRPMPHFLELARRKGARVVTGDLADPFFRRDLPRADVVAHAAGYGQPQRFLASPTTTMALNVCATMDLLNRLPEGGRFLFLSSSEVYSGLPPGKHTEDQIGSTTPAHPRACYIEGKRGGEALCQVMAAKGVQARAARLALAYGPGVRLDDARVLNVFLLRGLDGKVFMADRGLAVRTYCYVADAVEILWRVLLDGRETVYNVGGTSRTTIADLASDIADVLGVPLDAPQADAYLADAPGEVSLDLSRLERDFSKTFFTGLRDGLLRTAGWLRALKAAERNTP